MSETPRRIRIALLTSGPTLAKWAATATERMLDETSAEVVLVIEEASTGERSPVDAVRRLVELREWGPVAAGIELLADEPDAVEQVPVRDLEGLEDPEWLTCDPVTADGWKNQLPGRAVDRLAGTDVALRFGFGFLVGEALSAPTMGVLSFHHGDFREYRGQPMGFWEYVHGRETAGVTLQRITETLDGGEILAERRVDIANAPTWGAVKSRLYAASEGMLAEGIRTLRNADDEPVRLSESELGDLYTHPRGRPVLTYLRKTATGKIRQNGTPWSARLSRYH
ncbi:formyltransferase family protein [Halorarum salinum]|uniref:Methionyl-tRNA formyltransferase-like protein n=1 Tax=Halorarum salinum TaxID=2743089 RepID=A0A7D5LDC8_9EURY|nr:formyltransferase family protein [Halobaculum salinum]QLG63295.1 methionyl-tRNA formyltransferase-like protein [Halobaculum salinum]